MKGNPHPTRSRPASGGLIRLQAHPTGAVNWLSPAWAVLCGAVASGGLGWRGEDGLRLALLVLLVDAGWGTLWTSLGSTDWATPLRRWRNWRFGEPVTTPPYTLPGSLADRLSHTLGQLRAWWRDLFWPSCGLPFSAIVIALPVTAVLAALLGTELLLLSMAALTVMQLGLAWVGGQGIATPKWDAGIGVALPWLAGHLTFGTLTLRSVGLALAFALAWGSAWQAHSRRERALGIVAQILAAALLVALHRPLAAGCLSLLLVPQLALLPWLQRGQPASWYVRYARPWLMMGMLVAAWAL